MRRVVKIMLFLTTGLGVACGFDGRTTMGAGDPPMESMPATLDHDGTAPDGATILFDGSDLERWRSARTGDDATWTLRAVEHAMEVEPGTGDVWSRDEFGDMRLHMEWWSPPGGQGQGGGNSGIKFQRRYEVQILNTPPDKWPLNDNEAGAIYSFFPPDSNASRGPGTWQSYDIWFRAPRFEGETKIADAELTVYWNGTRVHDRAALPGVTGANPLKETAEPDAILLQDHGARVRYRNIWIIEPPRFERSLAPPINLRVGHSVAIDAPICEGVVDRFEVEPALPRGLEIDPATGRLFGTATRPIESSDHVLRAINTAGESEIPITIGISE